MCRLLGPKRPWLGHIKCNIHEPDSGLLGPEICAAPDERYLLFIRGQLEECHLVPCILNPVSPPILSLDLVIP